jgi:pimeloyl-ACP methyl ester carboxylesterase
LLAKREIPAELVASWTAPGRKSEIRRDTRKLLAGIHKRQTLEAAERLKAFDRPALLTWGVDDRFFKLELAERLRETIPTPGWSWSRTQRRFRRWTNLGESEG